MSGADQLLDPRARAGETKRRRTRAAILRAADELFSTYGWAGTSIELVAERSGASVATVYGHFAGKGAIVEALTGEQFAELADLQHPRLLDPDVVAALDWWVDGLARTMWDHRHVASALLLAAAGGPVPAPGDDPAVIMQTVPTVPALAAIVARGQANGVFADYPTAVELARAVMHTLTMRCVIGLPSTAEETSRQIRTYARRLLRLPDPA